MDEIESAEDISNGLGLKASFPEKLLKIEELTMLAKTSGGDARHENLSGEPELLGSMNTTAFRLRSLILSLTNEEAKTVQNYLGDDYWCPGYWSAGGY